MEDHRTDFTENPNEITGKSSETNALLPEETEGPEVGKNEAASEKKPVWKKFVSAVWDIAVICLIVYGVNAYYTGQMQEQFDSIARSDAIEEHVDLDQFGIDYSLEVTDDKLPKAKTYSWKEIRDGGGRPAMLFQMLMFNESFPEIFKTGKSVRYLNCTRTVKVSIMPEGAEEPQYIGDVDVTIQAFYQGLGRKGMLYFDDAESGATLKSFINSYADTQEQKLFKQSFTVQGSTVDYYNETITIDYDWTNLFTEEVSPMWAFSLTAYQNGHELLQDYYNSKTDSASNLAPGSTGSYSITYYLRDTASPVTLVVANSYNHFFEDDPPTMEFEIALSGGTTASQSSGYPQFGASTQEYSNIYELFQQFQSDLENGNYTESEQGYLYNGEEVRDYRNYDDGEDLAELTLHDFGAYGEVAFYALGQDILTYGVSYAGSYTFSGYTADYFQFEDYTGLQDLFIFRSGNQEWLVTWDDHHRDGAAYTYEP